MTIRFAAYILLALAFVGAGFFFTNRLGERGNAEESIVSEHEENVQKEGGVLPREYTLLFLGDTMIGRHVGEKIASGFDPFHYVRDELVPYDGVAVNLEGPFTEKKVCQKKPYSFRFEPKYIDLLKGAGITAASVANNHSLDCFREGLRDTRELLEEENVVHFGGFSSGTFTYVSSEYPHAAFVGFDVTIGLTPLQEMVAAVAKAEEEAEVVFVMIHWGKEYEIEPVQNQRIIAGKLTEAGADLIIGHHPHVIEPLEVVNGAPVAFSLGNFVFDQIGAEENQGYAVDVALDEGSDISALSVRPYVILHSAPKFLEDGDERREKFCRRILEDRASEKDPCVLDERLLK